MKNIWSLVLFLSGLAPLVSAQQTQHLYTKPSRFYMRFEVGGGKMDHALVHENVNRNFNVKAANMEKGGYLVGYEIAPHFMIESGIYIYTWQENITYKNASLNKEIHFEPLGMMTAFPFRLKAGLPILKDQFQLIFGIGGQISKKQSSYLNSVRQQWINTERALIRNADYYAKNPEAKALAEVQVGYAKYPSSVNKSLLTEGELGLETKVTKTIRLYVSTVFLAEYGQDQDIIVGYAEKGEIKEKVYLSTNRYRFNTHIGIKFRPMSAYKQ